MRYLLSCLFFIYSINVFSQLNIQFRSNIPYGSANELANIGGYVDSTGKEYALVGCETGLSIVDVTNPAAPFQKTLIPGTTSLWREVKVWGKYAYVTTEGGTNGLQIINLGKLPGTITVSDYKYWKGTGAINGLISRLHSLHIDNGYAYLNGVNGGGLLGGACLIVSLADPWNPVYVGNTQLSFSGSNRYVHDCFVRNDTLWGAHIYGGFFSVINIANKAAPVLISTETTPNAFTHNAWLNTSGSRTLFTTDEVSNSYMTAYDVSDVNNITELDRIQLNPGSGAIVHNTHVKDNYAVVSWYKDGVAIVDVSRPDNMIITGHYDTYSQGTGSGFFGCWGVYPFLPSGNLVASDINNGLYVLTPTYVRGCYLEGSITDGCSGSPLPNVNVTISTVNISKQGKVNGIYKTGTAIPGSYSVTFTKSGYDPLTINNVALANGVLTSLNVQMKPAGAVNLIQSTVSDAVCTNESSGAIDIDLAGTHSPFSFQWSNGSNSEDVAGLGAGQYIVTVTDNIGCGETDTFLVSQPPAIAAMFSAQSPSCAGNNDGSITAMINGGTPGYAWSWQNTGARGWSETYKSLSVDSASLVNISAGSYTLTVTDDAGCIQEFNYLLNDPSQPCSLALTMRLFTEGFYSGNYTMNPVAEPVNFPLVADTFIVQLADTISPYAILFSDTACADVNGWLSFNFPGACWQNNYFLVIRHRNSLETWSVRPVHFNAPSVTFNFANSPFLRVREGNRMDTK